MKTPIFLLSQILLILFAGLPQAGISQWIIPVPCAVSPASFSSRHEALYHDLTPARELMQKCKMLHLTIDHAIDQLAPGHSEADLKSIQDDRRKVDKMEAHIEAMRRDLARTYPVLSDSLLPTEYLLLATPNELSSLMDPARCRARGVASR